MTGKDRNKVMCWEMCFENSMAIIIGNTALPVIVEALSGGQIDYDEGVNLEDARTLGTATALIACVAWSICMVVYAGLMWSFPGDLERLESEKRSAAGAGAVDDMELVAGEFAS